MYGYIYIDSPKWVKSKKRRGEKREKKKDRKLLIIMASYALQTPPWVAHAKPPGPKYGEGKKFSLGSFPEVGQKQRTEKKKKKRGGGGETKRW